MESYPIVKIHKSFFGVFWFFWGVGVVRFFSKFRIQSRMILVNSVPNPKSVAPKLQKLSHRKVPIIGGRRMNEQRRHQSGKTYSLVEMKFRRDKNLLLFITFKQIKLGSCSTSQFTKISLNFKSGGWGYPLPNPWNRSGEWGITSNCTR